MTCTEWVIVVQGQVCRGACLIQLHSFRSLRPRCPVCPTSNHDIVPIKGLCSRLKIIDEKHLIPGLDARVEIKLEFLNIEQVVHFMPFRLNSQSISRSYVCTRVVAETTIIFNVAMPSRRCRSRQRNRIVRCIPVRRPTAIGKGIISRIIRDDNFIIRGISHSQCITTIYRAKTYTANCQLVSRHITIIRHPWNIMGITSRNGCRSRMPSINNHIPTRHIRSINMFKRQLPPAHIQSNRQRKRFPAF